MVTDQKVRAKDCAPPLQAKLAPWMQTLLKRPELAAKLVETHGSPLHLVVASEFRRNVASLKSALNQRQLQGSFFFARKANKLPWFVSLAAEEGIGVDTASLTEVVETLALGVNPRNVTVTAVGKDARLLTRSIEAGCLVVIDNRDELELTKKLAAGLGKPARIGLRFAGFQLPSGKLFSRFGFRCEQAPELLQEIADCPDLQLQILHAHLDRYETSERAGAGHQLISLADQARALGHKIEGIDLGGGILMRYLDSESQWQSFLDELVDSVAEKRPKFTFNGDGFGFQLTGDQVTGKADLYPAWNPIAKERFIGQVLDHKNNGVSLAEELRQRDLHVFFEPGRCLLDNTGMTLASVSFRKQDTLGNQLVGLTMNRMNLRPFRAEFCSDPYHLSLKQDHEQLDQGVFLVGNLCSESDLIFRRKLHLDKLPKVDDLFCFANTAGYLAHHMEIGSHGDPRPANLLLDAQTLDVLDKFAN